MKTFTLNGKQYPVKSIGFGMMRKFGRMGIDFEELQEKPLDFISAYFAICMGVTMDEADDEIDAHLEDENNSFEDLMSVFKEATEKSGFFRSKKKDEDKAVTADTTKSE